jgi:hypothetical protein
MAAVILGRRDALLKAAAALAGRRAVAQSASGNGSLQHLVMERFAPAAGVKLNHIPYRGGAPAANDLIVGQVQLFFGNVNVSARFVHDGALSGGPYGPGAAASPARRAAILRNAARLRDLRVERRLPAQGYAAAPCCILERRTQRRRCRPDLSRKLREADLQAAPNTPAEFAAFFREQCALWQGFVRETGIRLE